MYNNINIMRQNVPVVGSSSSYLCKKRCENLNIECNIGGIVLALELEEVLVLGPYL